MNIEDSDSEASDNSNANAECTSESTGAKSTNPIRQAKARCDDDEGTRYDDPGLDSEVEEIEVPEEESPEDELGERGSLRWSIF